MCGIFCSVSQTTPLEPNLESVIALKARGPDSFFQHTVSLRGPVPYYLTFVSTVLALRGEQVERQPLIDDSTGSVLCWNGEAWQIDAQDVVCNDTLLIFRLLLEVSSLPLQNVFPNLLNALTKVAGPFAFVYYDALRQKLWYGRDRLGRRSLMISQNGSASVQLSSISTRSSNCASSEVNTTGVFEIDVNTSSIFPTTTQWPPLHSSINRDIPRAGLSPSPSPTTIDGLLAHLQESLRLRATDIPTLSSRKNDPDSAKLAILFSGGLDCTLLARLTHNLLPDAEPVDLLNVAFENPRLIAARSQGSTGSYEACPDRITGRESFAELVSTCPQRAWRFVAIDIPFADTVAHRSTILDLMHPHNTEMDLSIAMALYFAARGQGVVSDSSSPSPSPRPYTTTARVLISGLGADELFAGYSRHTSAFSRGGFPSLIDELDLDFTRIGQRNLGRDDRIISHWGREVRYPYLDENFVSWALSLPVWEKCGFRPEKPTLKHFEVGGKVEKEADLEPAKMLLRLAAWRVGMKGAAAEKKRAIQFGARTAKMELGKGGGKRKGTDIVQ